MSVRDPRELRDVINSSQVDEELKQLLESRKANIKVIGIGGAGNNTITRMSQIGILGTEIVGVNTDAQDLLYTEANKKVLVGKELTRGLGAGADPKVGMEAARESRAELKKAIEGSDMVFITCGLGGGTGTGGAPIVADIARKEGALVVGIVSLPFSMEGKGRNENAQLGLESLDKAVDTLIVIPNDKLLDIVPDVSIVTAFKVCDEILVNAVKGIAELVTKPGLVNLDFADIKTVMGSGGLAMIGMGESDTENRAVEAVTKALNNPLLDVEIEDAKGAVVNVLGGADVTLKECQEIVEAISSKLSPDAKIIWGAQIDKDLGSTVKAMLIITGVTSNQIYNSSSTFSDKKKKEIEKVLGIEFVE